jgi:hypothetical protein
MPGYRIVRRWRREEPGFDYALTLALKGGRRNRSRANAKPSRGPGARLTRRIGRALADGATITELCARPGMPSVPTFYAWRSRFPAFAEEVAEALDHRDWLAADTKAAAAEEAAAAKVAAWKAAAEKKAAKERAAEKKAAGKKAVGKTALGG